MIGKKEWAVEGRERGGREEGKEREGGKGVKMERRRREGWRCVGEAGKKNGKGMKIGRRRRRREGWRD